MILSFSTLPSQERLTEVEEIKIETRLGKLFGSSISESRERGHSGKILLPRMNSGFEGPRIGNQRFLLANSLTNNPAHLSHTQKPSEWNCAYMYFTSKSLTRKKTQFTHCISQCMLMVLICFVFAAGMYIKES